MEYGLLIIAGSPAAGGEMADILKGLPFKVTVSCDLEDARQILVEKDFDAVIFNNNSIAESGKLAGEIISGTMSSVIFVVPEKLYDKICAKGLEHGFITLCRPLSKNMFLQAVNLAAVTAGKLGLLREKNKRLQDKLAEVRLVDRAKCVLMQYLKMTEGEAHRYIEKQAMDRRSEKGAIAENILKTYED